MICIITLNGSVCDKYSNIFKYSLPNTEYSNKIIEIYTNKYIGLFEKLPFNIFGDLDEAEKQIKKKQKH